MAVYKEQAPVEKLLPEGVKISKVEEAPKPAATNAMLQARFQGEFNRLIQPAMERGSAAMMAQIQGTLLYRALAPEERPKTTATG